jgi:hypothetical protein
MQYKEIVLFLELKFAVWTVREYIAGINRKE